MNLWISVFGIMHTIDKIQKIENNEVWTHTNDNEH